MSEPLTSPERRALLRRLREIDQQLYPEDPAGEPTRHERMRLEDRELEALGEYADRIPRLAVSRCPITGQVLARSFDPFGLDGPWWQKERTVTPDEPAPPPTFKVLLGALDLKGREPEEATDEVLAGPDVPFVVPRLLGLPGMVAVVSRLPMETGDLAYPVAYFTSEDVPSPALHQFWTRGELWFKTKAGGEGWIVKNDVWDFDLAPWIAKGKLYWIAPGDPKLALHGQDSKEPCPYLGLPGDRMNQVIADGERDLVDPPDGEPPQPFELDEDEKQEEEEEEV